MQMRPKIKFVHSWLDDWIVFIFDYHIISPIDKSARPAATTQCPWYIIEHSQPFHSSVPLPSGQRCLLPKDTINRSSLGCVFNFKINTQVEALPKNLFASKRKEVSIYIKMIIKHCCFFFVFVERLLCTRAIVL